MTNLLSSVARQLIDQGSTIPHTLYHQFERNRSRPSHQDLLESLAEIALGFSSIFLIVDALDECNSIDGTRTSLVSSLRKYLHQGAHLLFTSRPSGDIESLFKDCPQLEIRASERDIRCHVSSRLMSEPRLVKHIATDAGLLNAILDTIVVRSDGMWVVWLFVFSCVYWKKAAFVCSHSASRCNQTIVSSYWPARRFLLAQLHIGALSRKHTKKAIRSALHTLPTEIDNMYHEAMQRIGDQSEEDARLAKDILTLVCYAVRPLNIDELRHALATSGLEGDKEISDEDLTDSEILVSICAGYVTIIFSPHCRRWYTSFNANQ